MVVACFWRLGGGGGRGVRVGGRGGGEGEWADVGGFSAAGDGRSHYEPPRGRSPPAAAATAGAVSRSCAKMPATGPGAQNHATRRRYPTIA